MIDSPTPRIAVIGGGLAGLVAAWELARHGSDVTLFERGERLGGRICSGEISGVTFDLGPESFATRGGAVERLIADLGLQDHVTTTRGGRSWIIGDGRAAPLPQAGAIGIPARPLSAETRRVIGLGSALRCAIEPWLPAPIGRSELSLGGLVRARLGRRTLTRLVAPVVRGVYSADPDALPLAAVPGLAKSYAEQGSLRVAARKQRGSARAAGAAVAGLRGGIHTLVEHLERELEALGARVRLGAEVLAVRDLGVGVDAGGYEVNVGGQGQEFDAVLVTVPGVVPLVSTLPQDGVETKAPATRIEVIALLVKAAALNEAPRGSGALVAEDARRATPPIAAKALTHANMKWEWLAYRLPADHHLLRLSYGEHGAEAITLDMSDAEAQQLALHDASAILGATLPETAVRGMARQQHTLAAPDYSTDPARLDPMPEGIALAGEWIAGTGFAAVVPSARAAASNLLASASTQASETSQDPQSHEGASHEHQPHE